MFDVTHLTSEERARLLALLDTDDTITELPPPDRALYDLLPREARDALPEIQLTALYTVTRLAFGSEYTRIQAQILGAKKPIQWNERTMKWEDVR